MSDVPQLLTKWGLLGPEREFGSWDQNLFPLCHWKHICGGLAMYVVLLLTMYPSDVKKPTRQVSKKGSTTAQQQQQTGDGAKSSQPGKKKTRKIVWDGVRIVMLLHNVILAIFSFACFVSVVPTITGIFYNFGFKSAILHEIPKAYLATSFGWWSWAFYVSKFYEFGDTIIIMYKGRRPMFLQIYHHIGAAVGMWMCMASTCAHGYLFICWNSLIHTFMYTYYAVSLFGIRTKHKWMLTMLQIIQFVTGLSLGIYGLVALWHDMTFLEAAVLGYHMLYVGFLLVLFIQFFKSSYSKKRSKTA